MAVLADVRTDWNDVLGPSRFFDEEELWIMSLPIGDTFEGETIDPQSLHKYLYCHADPVNFNDPTGRYGVLDAALNLQTLIEFFPFGIGGDFLLARGPKQSAKDTAGAMFGWIRSLIPTAYVRVNYRTPTLNWEPQETGSTPQDVLKLLNEVARRRGTITTLVLKGHGGDEGVQGDNNDYLLYVDSTNQVHTGDPSNVGSWQDITALLRKVTDANSQISLRGCSTAPAANRLARILGNGATVSGNSFPTVNILFSDANLSIWWENYSYPKP